MIYNIFHCPHCGKATLQVNLGPCLFEDDDQAILTFQCTNCGWEHKLGDDGPGLATGITPQMGYSAIHPGVN